MNDIINNTQEAIVFGQSMNEAMMEEMKRGQKLWYAMSKAAVKDKNWEAASELSFKSQLCREAVEAYNGTLKLRGQV